MYLGSSHPGKAQLQACKQRKWPCRICQCHAPDATRRQRVLDESTPRFDINNPPGERETREKKLLLYCMWQAVVWGVGWGGGGGATLDRDAQRAKSSKASGSDQRDKHRRRSQAKIKGRVGCIRRPARQLLFYRTDRRGPHASPARTKKSRRQRQKPSHLSPSGRSQDTKTAAAVACLQG